MTLYLITTLIFWSCLGPGRLMGSSRRKEGMKNYAMPRSQSTSDPTHHMNPIMFFDFTST